MHVCPVLTRFTTPCVTTRQLVVRLAVFFVLVVAGNCGQRVDAQDGGPLVLVARIEDQAISPVTARYIARAIEAAESQSAECLVIMLDTPGGLATSTREIVKQILGSRTCVVVYVAPHGAEAASAGGFITLSAHVAAMAPSTTIGAMHPVSIGGLPIPTPTSPAPQERGTDETPKDAEKTKRPASTMEEKVVNNTAAWARGLARHHGRNADWAERAVNESIVATETEAVEAGVVDLVAPNLRELVEQISGRSVELAEGPITLETSKARLQDFEMWWGDRFLATLANPNVAFLLMVFGFYGVLFEFYSPGWGVAGTLGIVCIVLAFFGLSVLPINYTGLLLIALAMAMFVAEVFVSSYGALAAGGIVCLTIGGLMLVDSPAGFARVSIAVVAPLSAATALITIFLVGSIVRAHRSRVQTGSEGLLGTTAIAANLFEKHEDGYRGTVQVHGEFWNAWSSEPIAAQQQVSVIDREGVTLRVEPTENEVSARTSQLSGETK